MSDCCQRKSCELATLAKQQRQVLWTVLGINAVMFGVELLAGLTAASLALTGDSLDMLGDAIAYGSSLYAINRGMKVQAVSALLKGLIMLGCAIAVFARAIYQAVSGGTPELEIMGTVGLLVLGANLFCLFLLTKHRQDNLNMSSVWLCSRNDIIANVSVLVAAGVVWLTGQSWPDLVVGLLITFIFARSAGKVLTQAWQQLELV